MLGPSSFSEYDVNKIDLQKEWVCDCYLWFIEDFSRWKYIYVIPFHIYNKYLSLMHVTNI